MAMSEFKVYSSLQDKTKQAMRRPPSVLVLTKDEEVNIADCLRTLAFSDDIVVLDSYSTDRTVEIARSFPNVRVIQRKFDNWSRHSNWALENIDFKYPWVYYSDADERVTPALAEELLQIANDASRSHVAYRVRYKNIFLEQWIRRGGIYPVWIIRLFQPDKVRYEDREVNAHPIVNGSLGELREHFLHYSFNKGLVPWFTKHNSYSQMEAHEAIRVRGLPFWEQVSQVMSSKDRAVRRRGLKNLSFRMPMRALMRFLYMYFVKLGMLDGRAGFHYSGMISMYEYWISIKMAEHHGQWSEKTETLAAKLLSEESV